MKALSKQSMMEYVATEVGEPVIESSIVNRVGFVKDYMIGELGKVFADIGAAEMGIVGEFTGGLIGGTFVRAFTEYPDQGHSLPDKMLIICDRLRLCTFYQYL
ncbi:hypothetical protein H6G81_10765 [Scytonema hofmannii FACHB-248]|uniref:PRC-barrel domain-containing protein n=1 Tax=Scytonema hofmannii FACHB-248 TaxID=1842502 RepID=A0ABR8GNJ7_9CYAN|nr:MULTISPECIES: hypothetical protein [Nostocales]MBD2604999.1 hypothetical protein [Scytonema hofmannii FACHB-248]